MTDTLDATLFGTTTKTKPKRSKVERDDTGRPVRRSGWSGFEDPDTAWIKNPSGLTIDDIEVGLADRLRLPVYVESYSSDPADRTVVGTCNSVAFTITARPGEDLNDVLRRLVANLKAKWNR